MYGLINYLLFFLLCDLVRELYGFKQWNVYMMYFLTGFGCQLAFYNWCSFTDQAIVTVVGTFLNSFRPSGSFFLKLVFDVILSVCGSVVAWQLVQLSKSVFLTEEQRVKQQRKKEQKTNNDTIYKKIAAEIVSSELSYCQQLDELFNIIYLPLLNETTLLTVPQRKIIFSEFEMIRRYNTMLANDLEIDSGSIPSICNRLREYIPFFIIYAPYASTRQQANITLTTLATATDTTFQDWLDSRLNKCEFFSRLDSYLILPVQRIMRYPLLLQELAKVAPIEYQDEVRQTHTAVLEVSKQVNDAMADGGGSVTIQLSKEHLEKLEADTQERIKAIANKVNYGQVVLLLLLVLVCVVWFISTSKSTSSNPGTVQYNRTLANCVDEVGALRVQLARLQNQLAKKEL